MKIQRRKIEREANEATIALAWVVANAAGIEERANSDGYGGFGPGVTGRSPGVSDPTASAALSRRDRQAELAAGQFRDALFEANRAARRAENIGRSLLAIPAKEAKKQVAQTPDAAGICANPACKVDVYNTTTDRIRAGRCTACYLWRRAHHGNERPREICHPVVSVE